MDDLGCETASASQPLQRSREHKQNIDIVATLAGQMESWAAASGSAGDWITA
jgi:hypothetical protein